MIKSFVDTTLNAKISEIKSEIPSITKLAATVAPFTVEKKIPSVSDLVKKADYDAKILELKENVLLHLIIISSQVIHLMQR